MLFHRCALVLVLSLLLHARSTFSAVLTSVVALYIPFAGMQYIPVVNGLVSFIGEANGVTTYNLAASSLTGTLIEGGDIAVFSISLSPNQILFYSCDIDPQATDAACIFTNSNPNENIFVVKTETQFSISFSPFVEIGVPVSSPTPTSAPPAPTSTPPAAPQPSSSPSPVPQPTGGSGNGNDNGGGDGSGESGDGGDSQPEASSSTANAPTTSPPPSQPTQASTSSNSKQSTTTTIQSGSTPPNSPFNDPNNDQGFLPDSPSASGAGPATSVYTSFRILVFLGLVFSSISLIL